MESDENCNGNHIEIRATRSHKTNLKCDPKDIVPRRFGVDRKNNRLILEYEVKKHNVLAHHHIPISPRDGNFNGESDPAVAAKAAIKKHRLWLSEDHAPQVAALISRLWALESPDAKRSVKLTEATSDVSQSQIEERKSPDAEEKPINATPVPLAKPRPLEATEAAEAVHSVFGRGSKNFPNEWKQGFCLERHHSCPYGLKQIEGGPCGVIAVVQAFLLRRLLMSSVCPQSASLQQTETALKDAMTDILFQCGIPVRVLTSPVGSKGILQSPEGWIVNSFAESSALRQAWERAPLSQLFVEGGSGVVQFLYSALLTHGLDVIRTEVDDPSTCTMVGGHGYCTQEMVNLLISGGAASNVFDGTKTLGEGKDVTELRGIDKSARVGFLSLFEAYGSLEVGQNLKEPEFPVWVVHAESHYSVAFGNPNTDPKRIVSGGTLDIWYYDPLGRQDEEKRITIQPGGLSEAPDEDDLDENGMIAKVLRTKWGKLAALDWNGAEPVF